MEDRPRYETNHPDDLIHPAAAKELAQVGALREALCVPSKDGWHLVLKIGIRERTLRIHDAAKPRLFGSLDTAARMARRLGIPRLQVELV